MRTHLEHIYGRLQVRRYVPLATDAHAEIMSRPQAFGIGVPWHWRTTRMTVRPGPALALRLFSGYRLLSAASVGNSDGY